MIDLGKITGFDWNQGNIDKSYKKHGVTPNEAEEVFLDENIGNFSPSRGANPLTPPYIKGEDGTLFMFILPYIKGDVVPLGIPSPCIKCDIVSPLRVRGVRGTYYPLFI